MDTESNDVIEVLGRIEIRQMELGSQIRRARLEILFLTLVVILLAFLR